MNKTVKKQQRVHLQLRLPPELHEKLFDASVMNSKSLNEEIITRLLTYRAPDLCTLDDVNRNIYQLPMTAKLLMQEVLEEFYEKRKNVAIDREVDRKLKEVLLTAAGRIPPTPSP